MSSRVYHYPGSAAVPLPTVDEIKKELPLNDLLISTIHSFRENVTNILSGDVSKLLFIVGPCSIHDTKAALEFAEKFKALSDSVRETMHLVMRVYCEKPRTSSGWKGLVYDPHLTLKGDIAEGIRTTRQLMLKITELGVPIATEFLDPLTCHYYHDLVTWGSVGARTSASQIHRQLASGLPMPIGFKNTTDGDLMNAVNGILTAKRSQSHIAIDDFGKVCSLTTSGNPHAHLVLRGGESKPNFDRPSVAYALELLATHNLPMSLLIDCSHDNSRKTPSLQPGVFRSVMEQIEKGNEHIVGMLLESHLEEGQQDLQENLSCLKYGVSVTDACLSWEATELLLSEAHAALLTSRHKAFSSI